LGKRSSFKRSPRDFYPTPRAAVAPLLPWLAPRTRFCEPCAGAGHLIESLEGAGHKCIAAYDIAPSDKTYIKQDAIKLKLRKTDCFITNPPWERDTLHAIIDNLAGQHPTWLL